jgi:hypothetical protein
MTENIAAARHWLEFAVFSGGTVTIDLARCEACQAMPCLDVCRTQGGPLVRDPSSGLPTVRVSLAEIKRGVCIECLGCELDCELHGMGALTIELPLAGFDEYIRSCTGMLVYRR